MMRQANDTAKGMITGSGTEQHGRGDRMSLTDGWPCIKLLLADYLKRTWIMGAIGAFYYAVLILLWVIADAYAADVQPARACLGVFFYLVAMNPRTLVAMDADRRVLGSLPMSRDDRGLAVWVQMVILPFCLCMALSVSLFLLIAPLSLSLLGAVQSLALLIAVNAFSLSVWAMWSGCVPPVLRRLGATGLIKQMGWLAALIMLSMLGLGGALLGWTMTVLSANGAIAVLGAAAALFSRVSLYFRCHLDVPWRAVDADPSGMLMASAIESLPPRKSGDRHRLWLKTLGMGTMFALVMLLPQLNSPGLNARHFSSLVGNTFVNPLLLGMLGQVFWLPSPRALRMLPITLNQLVRMLMTVQLTLTGPYVVTSCLGALYMALSTGEIVAPCTIVGAVLGGEALLLLSIPLCFQYWEKVVMGMMGAIIFGSVFIEVMAEEILRANHGNMMVVALPVAAIVAPISLVICFQEIRKFLQTDSRAYLKRSMFFLWRSV